MTLAQEQEERAVAVAAAAEQQTIPIAFRVQRPTRDVIKVVLVSTLPQAIGFRVRYSTREVREVDMGRKRRCWKYLTQCFMNTS